MDERESVARGAAEEASGAPLTETEVETGRRPAGQGPATPGTGDGGGDPVAEAARRLGAEDTDADVVEPIEERPEVAEAILDDTTAPGLGDPRS